ncbi:MAG: hypothetical protein QOD52_1865 [Gaiellaceae bacterium]|nr:hypothetical protein [Gaiellaceae bacterium]
MESLTGAATQELEQGLRSVDDRVSLLTDQIEPGDQVLIVDAAQQISRELGADFSSQNGG